MANFEIITDYDKEIIWNLSDNNGTVIQATAVGELAKIGSELGEKLAEQTEVFRDMVDSINDLRDNSSKFTPASFPAMQIIAGKITLPAEQDVTSLVSAGINIYSTATNVADIDKLVALEKWLDEAFGPTTSPAVKVTYQLPGDSVDTWVVLKDVVPIPTLPAGSVPQTSTGSVQINRPFATEGLNGTFLMVKNAKGETVQVTLKSMDEVFSKVTSLSEYQKYVESLALKRSEEAVKILNSDNITGFEFDTVEWKKTGDTIFSYAKLPIVSIQASDLASTVVPAGTILVTEAKDYYFVVSAKTSSTNAVTQKVVVGNSYLVAPNESSLSLIRSRYGDQITVATQVSANQGLFVNELMQKHTMHFEAASNVLKAFVDLMNRISNQV